MTADVAKAMTAKHVPVLLHESIDALNLGPGKTFLDGTFGGGGHTREVLRRFPQVRIVALDRDREAVERGKALGVPVTQESFSNLKDVFVKQGIEKVDAILFDLGISTDQFTPPSGGAGRGFSFLKDEPLDMRMSGTGITEEDILNSWDEHAIELILRGFGEERSSRKIAGEIVARRKIKPFVTTFDLVQVVGKRKGKIHPATKTFQALRIAVNDELTSLETGLEKGFEALGPKGRMAVISFHSLEDRIVKRFFRDKVKAEVAKPVTKKPIVPSAEEIQVNPRSRSAKLRVIEKNEK